MVSGALWSWHGIAAFDLSIDLAPRRERPFWSGLGAALRWRASQFTE